MSSSARWSALIERLVRGEQLSDDDAEFLERRRATDPECAAELEFLDGLTGIVDAKGAETSDHTTDLVRGALARIENEDPVPSRPRSNRRLLAGSAVAVAADLAALWWGLWPGPAPALELPTIASLTLTSGEVYVDGRPAELAGMELSDGATVAVAQGTACYAVGPDVDVCVGAGTTTSVHGLGSAHRRVEVLRGRAIARLDRQPDGRTFSLTSGAAVATAIGTIFALEVRHNPDEIRAAVIQGAVRLDVAGSSRELGPHDVATVRGTVVEQATLSPEDESSDLAAIAAVERLRAEHTGRVVVESKPAGATLTIDGQAIGQTPVAALVPAGEHRLGLTLPGHMPAEEAIALGANGHLSRSIALEPEPVAEAVVEPVPEPEPEPSAVEPEPKPVGTPEPTVRERPTKAAHVMLGEARTLLQSAKWSAAATAYRRLRKAHPRSPEAHTALVSLAELDLERLGRPRAAMRSYGRYLRGGGGPLAQEARYGRVRAARALGDRKAELDAIDSYLRSHPKGGHVGELRARSKKLQAGG